MCTANWTLETVALSSHWNHLVQEKMGKGGLRRDILTGIQDKEVVTGKGWDDELFQIPVM